MWAFLSVLLFLDLSEGPQAGEDHQPHLCTQEAHLTRLGLGLQNQLAFLLALATSTPSVLEISFLQALFPKGMLKKKM